MKFLFYSTILALATATAFASECEDNPDYLYRNRDNRGCDWVGRNERRTERLCNRRQQVRDNCPETCSLCVPDSNPGCPPSKPTSGDAGCSLVALAEEPNRSCFYDYQVLGCTPDELECKPTTSFTCDEDGLWVEIPEFLLDCVANDPSWGTDCTPCPTNKPTDGEACTTDRSEICEYDFEYKGCSSEEIRCEATTAFECRDNVWVDNSPFFLDGCQSPSPSDPRLNTPCIP